LEDEKMKKKALLVLVCVMALTAFTAGIAMAGYYVCTISKVGCAGTFYMLTLTDTAATPAFTDRDFVIDAQAVGASAMLASALTAYSMAGKLQVWLNDISPSANIYSAVCTN
jgi:hypothetical protein